jgi:predicted DNA-binding transcriptional regulator AlpA
MFSTGVFRNKWSSQMRIIRPRDTQAKVGLCDRELRDLEREGLFPKRFPLNPRGTGRAVGHLENEVDDWIAARAASRVAA